MKVADEVWVATANLHRSHPEQESFSAAEIFAEVVRMKAHPVIRPGVRVHISQHCVANLPPNPGSQRMLFRTGDGKYRLFRATDTAHPRRSGRITPEKNELRPHERKLVDWYHDEYDPAAAELRIEDDPVLKMRGVGKEMWAELGGGDAFIASERAGWDEED